MELFLYSAFLLFLSALQFISHLPIHTHIHTVLFLSYIIHKLDDGVRGKCPKDWIGGAGNQPSNFWFVVVPLYSLSHRKGYTGFGLFRGFVDRRKIYK